MTEAPDRLAGGAWADRAACLGTDVEQWFPGHDRAERATARRAIRRYCSRCPVRVECGAAGAAEPYGVWGGRMPAPKAERVMNGRTRGK